MSLCSPLVCHMSVTEFCKGEKTVNYFFCVWLFEFVDICTNLFFFSICLLHRSDDLL